MCSDFPNVEAMSHDLGLGVILDYLHQRRVSFQQLDYSMSPALKVYVLANLVKPTILSESYFSKPFSCLHDLIAKVAHRI